MVLAKRSRGGVSGWVAAGALALGLFATLGDSPDVEVQTDEDPPLPVEAVVQD